MQIAAMTADTYDNLSESNRQYLNSVLKTLDFTWYQRDESGEILKDEDGNYKEKTSK